MILRLLLAAGLVVAIIWGRELTPAARDFTPVSSSAWSEEQALWHRARAGAVPGLAADMAVLNIFNIYARATAVPATERDPWWAALKYQLRHGQHMDPYFRDIYRLTEGLLAWEAQDMRAAVHILSMSEPYLQSADPLLAAAFIARQELGDQALAGSLAGRAAGQPDSNELVLAFASNLIRGQSGCKAALAFLESRLLTLPEPYRQGIIRRIDRLRESGECREGI